MLVEGLECAGHLLWRLWLGLQGTNEAPLLEVGLFLLTDLPQLGEFTLRNSSNDEYGAAIGTLPAGIYSVDVLYDLTALAASYDGVEAALAASDLRFGYNGSLAGNVAFVPEPSVIALLTLGLGLLLLRRRR